MKIGDVTRKLSYRSTGTIEVHIHDKATRRAKTLNMTPAEIYRSQNQDKMYPFRATLESIDYIQGELIINGSLRAQR